MPAPPQFAPMLLTTGPRPVGGVVEPKWDGCRSMVTVHDGRMRIRSRNGHDVTDCYPELLTVPAPMVGRSAVFDCEIVAFDEAGRCNFQRLQRRQPVLLRVGPDIDAATVELGEELPPRRTRVEIAARQHL